MHATLNLKYSNSVYTRQQENVVRKCNEMGHKHGQILPQCIENSAA